MKVITNNVPRPVLYWYELTDAERKELDYVDTETAQDDFRGFRYRGMIFDLGEFTWLGTRNQEESLEGWHGIQTDSYFSGVVVRYSNDHESVVVGTVTW